VRHQAARPEVARRRRLLRQCFAQFERSDRFEATAPHHGAPLHPPTTERRGSVRVRPWSDDG
jgi:hypothetical protein